MEHDQILLCFDARFFFNLVRIAKKVPTRDQFHWSLAIVVAGLFGRYLMKSGSGRLAWWVEGTLSLPMENELRSF
jgi:hypothetical protein